jgi:hypothetical protein
MKGEIMAETSISALWLVSLLEKIGLRLRRFWDSHRSALASGSPFYRPQWDPDDITRAADYLSDLGLWREAKRLLVDWSQWEKVCDELPFMIGVLRSMEAEEGSPKYCEELAEEMGVFPDKIDPNDLSQVNRQMLLARRFMHLLGFVDELTATVKAKFPAQTLRPLAAETEASEGNCGAGLALTKTKKNKRGRKRLSNEETQRRNGILAEWEQARNAGTSMKTFCREHNPPLKSTELEKFVAWMASRNRRKDGS